MSFKFLRFHIGPFFIEKSLNRKDLSETNSKLKGPIWNLRNLKGLSETNSKLKGPI